MQRRKLALILGLPIVIALSVLGFLRWRSANESREGELPTAIVTRGDFEKTVNATGNLEPAQEASLSFGSAGTVAQVAVTVGDRVRPGQLLAKLEDHDLQLSLAAARADLEVARSNLASARQALRELEAGPSQRAIEEARIELDQAKNRLWSAQSQRDATCGRVKEKRGQQVDCDIAQAAVNQAEGALRAAQLKYDDVVDGPSASELAAARNKVAQAEAGMASAELRLNQAEAALAKAQLTSPITGTVTAVNIRPGQTVTQSGSASGAHIVVSDLDAFDITVQAAEADIGEIAVGQKAEVTLDVFPGQKLTGEVTAVAPTGAVESGVVLYPVSIRVRPGEVPARAGMTANVAIVTVNRPASLMVPLRAVVTTDEGSYVMRVVGASRPPSAAQLGSSAQGTTASGRQAGRSGAAGPEPPVPGVVMRFEGPMAGAPPRFAAGSLPAGSRRRNSAATAGGSAATTTGWTAKLSDAERVAVELGPANDSVVVIERGLAEGDVVLVASATSGSAGGRSPMPWGGFFGGRRQ